MLLCVFSLLLELWDFDASVQSCETWSTQSAARKHLQHHHPCFWHVLSSYVLVTVQSFPQVWAHWVFTGTIWNVSIYKRGNWGIEQLDRLPKVAHHQGSVPWVAWCPLGSRTGCRKDGAQELRQEMPLARHSSSVAMVHSQFSSPFTLHVFVDSPGLCGIWAQLPLFQWGSGSVTDP